jgi:hypothetical protein
VRTAVAMAASGAMPHRSVRVKSASALITTARPRLSCSNWAGLDTAMVSFSGRSASSIRPKRRPGRSAVTGGLVMDAAIIARTAP